MFSSVGATALPQAHPEMTLPTQRRHHSQAPLPHDHPSGSPPSCVAKPPCNYANCHTTPFGGRFNALTAEPNAQHPSAPSSLLCQPPPVPPTRASNAIIPVHARPPHTPLPKLGIVLTRRPSSLLFFSSYPMVRRCALLAHQARWASHCGAQVEAKPKDMLRWTP